MVSLWVQCFCFFWIFAKTRSCFWRDLPIVYLPSKNALGLSISLFCSYSPKIKSKAVGAFKVNSMFIALKYLQGSNPIQNLLFLYHRVNKTTSFPSIFLKFFQSQTLQPMYFMSKTLALPGIFYISALFYFNINAWWSLKLFTFLQNLYAPGLLG